MRRFTSLLIILFILAGLGVWAAGRLENVWEPTLKFQIETSLGKALGWPVHIARIRYKFPVGLRLIQIEAKPVFRADEMQAQIGFLNIPTAFVQRNPAECLSFIRLTHPQLRLTQEDADRFKRLVPHSKSSTFMPTFFGVEIENGLMEFTDNEVKNQTWTLQKINGLFNWRGPQQSFLLNAHSPLVENVHVDYSAFGRRWKSQLDVEGIDVQKVLEALSQFKGSPILPKDLRLTGLVDLSLKAGGRKMPRTFAEWPHFLSSVRWQATHGKIRFEEKDIPWSARGILQNRDTGFILEKGIFRLDTFSGLLTGRIKPFAALPEFDLEAHSAPHTDIETLMRLIDLPEVLQGNGDFILRLNGPVNDPRLLVQILLPKARLWDRLVTDVTLLARYSAPGAWELLDSSFRAGAMGHIRAQGSLRDDALSVHATAEQIPLKWAYPTMPLDGTLAGSLAIDGPWDDWQLRGSWWLAHLTWKAKSIGPDWRGDVQLDRSGVITLAGETADQQFHVQAHAAYDQATFHLTQAVLDLPGDKRIVAQGNTEWAKKTADFMITSDQLILQRQTLQHLKIQGTWALSELLLKVEGQQHADADRDPTPAAFSGNLHLEPGHFSADAVHYQRHNISLDAKTTATPDASRIPFEGSALLTLKGSGADTLIPITYKGHFEPDHANRGSAEITSGPVQASLAWDQLNAILIKAHLASGGWNTTSLRMDVQGTWMQDGQSTFTVHGASDPDGQLDALIALTDRHMAINRAVFRTPESRLEFLPGGTIDFPAEGDFQTRFSAKLRNLHLGFLTLFGSLDVEGKWSHGVDHSSISAQARTRSLFINDYELEEGQILAGWENGILRFSTPPHSPGLIKGAVNFQKNPQLVFDHLQITGKEGQKLDIDGEMGPALWNYALAGEGLDLGILSEISGLSIPMTGAANLKIVGHGDETHPSVEGHARIQQGSIANVRYESGETDFIWQGDRITFQHLQLKDSHRYKAIGEGVFPLETKKTASKAPPDINFTVRLEDTNLGLLQSVFPEIKSARGDVAGLVQIQGTLAEPTFRGHLEVENGDVTGAHYFRHLENIHVAADFDHERLRISEIRGRSGKGEFRVHGDVGLTGFSPSSFTLTAETLSKDPIDVEVPELAIPDSPLANRFKFLTSVSHINVNGHVQFTGSVDAPVFQGDVTLSNGHFTFPPSAKKSQSSFLTLWARRIFWDLALHFQDRAWFENELVEANVNGIFKIKGTADALSVDGGLTIPKGKISYLGLQFDIREARFDMKAGSPFLSGEADSQVQATDTVGLTGGVNTAQRFSVEDTITLTIPYGPLDQIKPRLTSATDPGLSQEKVVARVTQLDVEHLTPEERSYLYQQQAVSLIDNSLTTPLAQKVLKRTGIADRFRAEHVFDPSSAPPVDPITGQPIRGTTAADLFANTKYTVEKDLLSNLSLGYGVRFVPTIAADTNTRKLDLVSDVQMSYRAFKNVYVRGNYDLPSSNSSIIPDKRVTIEPRWRFGWWGNTNKPKPAAH